MTILAGDIRGTKASLALFRKEGEVLSPVRQQIFQSGRYRSLEEVIEEFMQGEKGLIRSACFGVTGPVVDGKSQVTNLPWIVHADKLEKVFGFSSVTLLNDLEATAYGTLNLMEKEYCSINPGQTDPRGNRAIIVAGTGLGEAVLFWNGSGYRVSASEGGHADFAPRNPLEIKLLEYLLSKFSRVSYERVLSGPGLLNIYSFLKETGQEEEPLWLSKRLSSEDPPAVISEVGLLGKAALCVRALDLFVTVYGAEAGNLALRTLATGGVYIGGEIAPKILDKLFDGTLMKAFLDKGRFSSFMNRIPVRVILNEKTALIGAARYAALKGKGQP